MRRAAVLAAAALLLAAPAVLAVTPGEMLADPALESRARDISAELRCLVCQNQSIDDSNADLARDLRILVRERLSAGDTDRQVLDYVVARYGEFVLLKPRVSMRTLMLWGAPFVVLLAGAAAIALNARGRVAAREAARLTPEEEREVARLVGDKGERE